MKKTLEKNKVVVGVSGGVDSAVCLKLLKARGFDVVPVYIRMCRYRGSLQNDILSASDVAKVFGCKLIIIDASTDFKKKIVGYFDEQIEAGKTPSPCVFCNPQVKLKNLFELADGMGIGYVATGHYAKVEKGKDGKYLLKKAKDKKKDQTYSLCFLSQEHLSRMILPLGSYSKGSIIEMADDTKGLRKLAKRDQSQDFCYFGSVDQDMYVGDRFGDHKGKIVDAEGRVVGAHDGLYRFTIGQRKGIGLSGGPYYVVKKDSKNNILTISSQKKDLLSTEVTLKPYNLIGPVKQGMEVLAKLRSTQRCDVAKVYKKGWFLKLKFIKPQTAVTPGQIAVFYYRDVCLGGGVING